MAFVGRSRLLRSLSSATAQVVRADQTAAVAVGAPRVFSSLPPLHPVEEELFARPRKWITLGHRAPSYPRDSYVAPDATIAGDVDLGQQCSIWNNAVLRGDLNNVTIGFNASVGDKTVIHAARTSPTGLPANTVVGEFSSIGSNCVLRSCTLGKRCVVGPKSLLMEGSVLEDDACLEAGTVVPPGRLIPGKQVWGGNPAEYVRDLTGDEVAALKNKAVEDWSLARTHQEMYLPYTTAYIEADALKAKFGYKPANDFVFSEPGHPDYKED